MPELQLARSAGDEADFIARLAVTSIGLGTPKVREPLLERTSKAALDRVTRGDRSLEDLTALRCLEMDDAVRMNRDPLPILRAKQGRR